MMGVLPIGKQSTGLPMLDPLTACSGSISGVITQAQRANLATERRSEQEAIA